MNAIKNIIVIIVVLGVFLTYSAYTANTAIESQTISVHRIDKKGLMDVKPYILGRLHGQKLDVTDYKKGLINTTALSMNEHLICSGLTPEDKQKLLNRFHLSFFQWQGIKAKSYLDKDKDKNCRLYLSRMQGKNDKVISAYAMSAVYLDAGVSQLSHCGILKLFTLSQLDTSKIKPQLQPSKSCNVKKIGVTKNDNRHPLKRAERSVIQSSK